ncbi:MAG: 4-hydroxy-tetrahydrodipicolinate synthase [Candidatus Muiribacteriota bacterium]
MLKGTWTALITPFKDNGDVDYEGLKKNLEHQIKKGVDGVLFLGTTSEYPTLTEEEKEKVLKTGINHINKRVKIMVGAGTNNTVTTHENARKYESYGIDYLLIVTPYYNKPNQTGIYRHFKKVADNVKTPICIYNIKGRTGTNIETSTMIELSKLPNIVGVKEASGDISQMGDVINQIKNSSPEFAVLSGDDSMTLPLMSLGGDGVISVISNVAPAPVCKIVNSALKNDFVIARNFHYRMLEMFKNAFIETNPQPVKKLMELNGLAAGGCRLPLVSVDNKVVGILEKSLKNIEDIL